MSTEKKNLAELKRYAIESLSKEPFEISRVFHTDYGRKIHYKSTSLGLNNEILICLHGFGGDKNSSVIRMMAEDRDFPCGIIAPDWPVHGESEAPDEELTVENCLMDLDALITMLRDEYPEKQISCFATSFGGYIATLYRKAHPDVFHHFILRSPALKMADVFRGLLTDEEFALIKNGEQVTIGFERKMRLGKAFYDSLLANPVYEAEVPNPLRVMIMQGDEDGIVNPEDIKGYAKKNNIRLKLFRGTDHRYKKEGEIERIIEYTKDFLETRYSLSDYGKIYRAGSGVYADVWEEDKGKWVKDNSSARCADISGRGGSWYNYNDLEPEKAWELIKEKGGTLEDFQS